MSYGVNSMERAKAPKTKSAYDDLEDLIAARDLPKHFPALVTSSQVEWMMRQRHANGLEGVVTKIGKKLYVNLPKFRDWVINQQS